MTLTGYIICKNEEAVIARCISSFKHVVDEIIVVDSGSTDKTVEIAQELGAKVYTIEWKDDFAYARNEALSHCTSDWVFYLDADEWLKEGDAEKIRPAIMRNIKSGILFDTISCTMVNIDPITNSIISNVTHILAFRRTQSMRYHRRIHEQLRRNGKSLKALFEKEITILHTGYTALPQNEVQNKYARNIKIIRDVVDSGQAEGADYYYYALMAVQNEQISANDVYDIAVKMYEWPETAESGVPQQAMHNKYIIIANAAQRKNLPLASVLSYIDQGIQRFPFHPSLYATKGKILWKAGYLRQALHCFNQASIADQNYNSPLTNDFQGTHAEISYFCALHCLKIGQPIHALELLVQMLSKKPFYQQALLALLDILRNEPPEDAATLLNKLYDRTKEMHMGILIKSLSQVRIPLLLNYYTKIATQSFKKTGVPNMAAFLSVSKYEQAVESAIIFLEGGNEDLEITGMAIAGILLGQLPDQISNRLSQSFPPTAPILACLQMLLSGNYKDFSLSKEHQMVFSIAWMELIHALPAADAQTLISATIMALCSENQILTALSCQLANAWRYELCEFFQLACIAELPDKSQQGLRLFNAGVSALMQNAPTRALDYFNQAQVLGYQSVEMQEYQEILQEKLAK